MDCCLRLTMTEAGWDLRRRTVPTGVRCHRREVCGQVSRFKSKEKGGRIALERRALHIIRQCNFCKSFTRHFYRENYHFSFKLDHHKIDTDRCLNLLGICLRLPGGHLATG